MAPATTKRIPKRLGKEPLLEAVWELRFQGSSDSMENLLSGIIYDQMRDAFSTPVRLPAADIPPTARTQQPVLNYTPMFRFSGKGKNSCYDIQVGPRAITLNCRRPYTGWRNYRPEILKLVEVVRKTGLIAMVERFSLKYVDLIPAAAPNYLAPLRGNLILGGYNLGISPVQVQSQLPDGNFINVITLLAPARVQTEHMTAEGLLIDIDTIFPATSEAFWKEFESLLDTAHDSNHSLFFDILKQETLDLLEPKYDQGDVPQ